MKILRTLMFLTALTAASCTDAASDGYVDWVNPLQGTNSVNEFSTGNTYPAVALPWGMNFWTPQTRVNGNGWQYVYTDTTLQGFKQTHQPSPWINDYGCFSLLAQCDEPVGNQKKRAVGFSHDDEISRPHYYKVTTADGITTEITPANAGAMFRFSYPECDDALLVIDCFHGEGGVSVDVGKGSVSGYSKFYAKNNNIRLPENFATYFTLTFDREIVGYGVFDEGRKIEGRTSVEGKNAMMYLRFGKARCVTASVASSFISAEQAEVNRERELAGKTFEVVKRDAAAKWNHRLSRIDVKGGSDEQRYTFYSALYRTLLFPRNLTEYTTSGKAVHYNFYDGSVAEGVMYADNGFWDTFRAVHPLFTLVYPSTSSSLMEALLNIYREGGWLPEWFSPAYKDCMIGQNSVSVVTDALAKGIDGFDQDLMYEAMVKGANAEGPNATGRKGFDYYNRLGYVPSDVGVRESVSRTLEYAYNDFCLSRYAALTNRDARDVELYRHRASNYRHVFDSTINFVRPRLESGRWSDDYAPDMWGGAFTEGSAWHWTWSVFHDPAGLIRLMGGEEAFVARMDSVFTAAPTFDHSKYKRVIHEMAEMAAINMGQYAHGNQPIQHMIYLYNYAGKPYKTQQHIAEVCDKLYTSGRADGKGLCGDEDNGQTSAWYVFSSLGFYPVCPGTSQYVIGTPRFEEAVIALENGREFKVRAVNAAPGNIYIQSATLNGEPFEESYITHNQITAGGELVFVMGDCPNKEWASASRPYSMSQSDNIKTLK